jgi:hypothetical protein
VAASVYFCGQMVVAVLQEIAGYVIAAGLVALAGGVTAETGVGPVIAGAVEAYLAWRASRLWVKALEWHGRAVAAGEGLVGVMGVCMLEIDKVSSGLVPAAYQGVEVGS